MIPSSSRSQGVGKTTTKRRIDCVNHPIPPPHHHESLPSLSATTPPPHRPVIHFWSRFVPDQKFLSPGPTHHTPASSYEKYIRSLFLSFILLLHRYAPFRDSSSFRSAIQTHIRTMWSYGHPNFGWLATARHPFYGLMIKPCRLPLVEPQ